MKIQHLTFALIFALFTLAACTPTENEGAYEEAEPTTEATSNPDVEEIPDDLHEEIEVEPLTFQEYWAHFSEHAEGEQFIDENTDFPYMAAGFETTTVTREDFEAGKADLGVFSMMANAENVTLEQFDGEYMNGLLSDFLFEKYGDLEHIYVAEQEAAPTGFLAYFVLMEDEFWFTGFEWIEIAD